MKYLFLLLIALSGCHCGEHCVKSHVEQRRSEDCYQQYMGQMDVGGISVPQYMTVCTGRYTTYYINICDKWEVDNGN